MQSLSCSHGLQGSPVAKVARDVVQIIRNVFIIAAYFFESGVVTQIKNTANDTIYCCKYRLYCLILKFVVKYLEKQQKHLLREQNGLI